MKSIEKKSNLKLTQERTKIEVLVKTEQNQNNSATKKPKNYVFVIKKTKAKKILIRRYAQQQKISKHIIKKITLKQRK